LPSEGTKQLLFTNLARWALSEFGTTSELVGNLSTMTVSHLSLHLGQDANVGIHWAVTDAAGDSRVIECTNGTGKCQVYLNNDVGILTNDPEYPWMVTNLNNYAFLSPDWVLDNNKKIQEKTGVPFAKGAGFNLRGLPGDTTPPSRFVKVFFEREYALLNDEAHLNRLDDRLFLAQSVINSVFIPKGVEANQHPMLLPIEYSQWAIMKLPSRNEIFVRSYNDMQWRHIDLNSLPLAEGDASESFLVEAKNQKFSDVVKPAIWSQRQEASATRNQLSSQSNGRQLPPLV
jgi:choloylglycine hydrolase